VDGLRADVKKNLEREVKFRVPARNKAAVMDALVKAVTSTSPRPWSTTSWSAWWPAPATT
jgi:trigger factor